VSGVNAFTGSVSYHLCGPSAAASTTTCDTGGVAVSAQNITTSGTYTSAAATVTAAGRYCWRADFSGDSAIGVPGSHDSSSSECFIVNPAQPTLGTTAGAGPVDFGSAVTDTATLSGTAHEPGTGGPTGSDGSINPATLGGDAKGTITFTLDKGQLLDAGNRYGHQPADRQHGRGRWHVWAGELHAGCAGHVPLGGELQR
jgi:hypothetical protein